MVSVRNGPIKARSEGSKMSPQKANEQALKDEQAKADAANATRTGVGTRVFVGQTRGKNPSVVTWEAFNQDKPDTLPKTPAQFMEVTKTNEDADLVAYLIDGYNKAQYSAASDEIGEFIEDAWDSNTKAQFRLVVRNYAKSADMTIEEAVEMVKPAIHKAWLKKQTIQPAA